MTDIQKKWKAGADKMAAWFESAPLPEGPIKVNVYSTITNIKDYVRANIGVIKHYRDNPTAAPFLPAYMRLFELKKYIENEQSGTINGKA